MQVRGANVDEAIPRNGEEDIEANQDENEQSCNTYTRKHFVDITKYNKFKRSNIV